MHGINDPAVEASVATYVKLMRAARAVLGRLEPLLNEAGLTVTQLGVLEVILHKGAMTHRDLRRKVLTSAGNMTDLVDKLEARGLVRRVRDEADRRLVRVELTEQGQNLIEVLFPRHAADIAGAMSGLSAEELSLLSRLLRRLGMAAAQSTPKAALEQETADA